jgi:hypothetical protein
VNVREQQEKRTCVWSRQPLKIEQLYNAAAAADRGVVSDLRLANAVSRSRCVGPAGAKLDDNARPIKLLGRA